MLGGGPWGVALGARGDARRRRRDALHAPRRSRRRDEGAARDRRLARGRAGAAAWCIAVPSTVARSVAARARRSPRRRAPAWSTASAGSAAEHLETVSDIVREETPVAPPRRARRAGAGRRAHARAPLGHGVRLALPRGHRRGRPRPSRAAALRVYATPDLRGLEWASALVGCLSIGVGFAEQAGAGPGLLAALISRGVDEAARIAAAAGAEERTMLGLGGYGDLLASIALDDRPEVVLGRALARGRSLDDACGGAAARGGHPARAAHLAFARERRVAAGSFEALTDVLRGEKPEIVLERMFSR